jgi:hypothetical protein
MSDSGLATLQGIITRLKAYAGLTALVSTRIYSIVPQQTAFPYVVVSMRSNPFDTKDVTGLNTIIRVQGFSRQMSYDEALNIRNQVMVALERQEANITISGFTLVKLDKGALCDIITEDDGITRQSIIEFDALIQ